MKALEKFHLDFNNEEIEMIKKIQESKKLHFVCYTKHANERIEERGIHNMFGHKGIKRTLKTGKVVKVSSVNNDLRLVIESADELQGKRLVLVVGVNVKCQCKLLTTWLLKDNRHVGNSKCKPEIDTLPLLRRVRA